MSSKNIAISDVFMRNSDDCIALYGGRWDFHGDTRNVLVEHSVLWADVAHPTNIGCHGDSADGGNFIEDIVFRDVDILEPCAHFGRTPPCAQLIVDKRIPRVVVGSADPFARVAGRGIDMMRRAGIEVVMAPDDVAAQCRALNPAFMTAHTLGRPFVVLKWAQSADGFVDCARTCDEPPARFSGAASRRLVHKLRADVDAIAVGSGTELMDRPVLDCRLWPGGRTPRRVAFTRLTPLSVQLRELYRQGVTSLLVEGGPTLAGSFLSDGLWDVIRVETSPERLGSGVPAPALPPAAMLMRSVIIGGNALKSYKNTFI